MNTNTSVKRSNRIRTSVQDKTFDIVNVAIMVLLLCVYIWPIWFVIIASFSDPMEVQLGKVLFLPSKLSIQSYIELINRSSIWTGYRNSLIYLVSGTFLDMVFTICAAYPLSRKDFMLRRPVMVFLLITMYFSGGLIPMYMLVKALGLINTIWCILLSGVLSVYNILIMRSYFMNSIPSALQEAAVLDGANSYQYLIKVVLPLSKPVLAVIALYNAVGRWNDYYTALVYIHNEDMYPLQLVLREILDSVTAKSTDITNNLDMTDQVKLAQSLKYSSIIVATIPIMLIYPFAQKYFVKGVMIGAVKG